MLSFEELVACLRAGSSAAECVDRLSRAASATTTSNPILKDAPELAQLTGYGEAMDWAAQLVDDLAKNMLANEVKPEVEIFDVAMLYNAKTLVEKGMLKAPAHVQFVLGIPNALPVREKLLDFLIDELRDQLPGATWTAAGIGRFQLDVNHWVLKRGGHARTGLEDNIYFEKGRLAASNAELVKRVADLCGKYDRHPATAQEARTLLGLRAA